MNGLKSPVDSASATLVAKAMDGRTTNQLPHRAVMDANGECKHSQPLWGFCRSCMRFDALYGYSGTSGEWGPETLAGASIRSVRQ